MSVSSLPSVQPLCNLKLQQTLCIPPFTIKASCGGDLIKWDKARIGFYVGIDISEGSFITQRALPLLLLLLKPSATQLLRLSDMHGLLNSLLLASSASGSLLKSRKTQLLHGAKRRSRITGMSVDIQSLRSLDRFFVFSGEQIQILACLSESKEDAEIITPFKVVEVMDKTVQRKLSDNGTSTPSGDGELSPDGQFAMMAKSGEPLWSKKTALVGDTKLDEKRKSGKKRPCVSLQVYIVDCPKEPTIWNLLKWLIPWDNTIYQQPRSLPPPIRSTPSISSSSHKPLLSFGSGSQLFSFRHFRSYSMSALPVPNTTPVTGPVKTQSSKPSFDLKTGPVTQAYAFLVEDGGGNLKSFNLLISIRLERTNSHEVVHEYMRKTEFVELMRRLGALGDGNQDQSTLSDDEWDAAYLYLSFVLRKRGGESDGGRRKNGKMNLSKDDVLYIATKV
ncbi:hypothetical protein IGI04_013697 [Brassica rapa subsp. trilocularis]|uniref:mRNA cap 0 methyltransferase domain-containing protein n=1 Tax=Brassica rapa subsp. trilocularis TaxID=1813537 RepID=A0ABQ7NA86_BRACM|nr:hypothetical protein IGI04_013697 [Brassica rapa subsp. trilocularis]